MASNDEIVTLLHEHHAENLQRLTRLETKLESMHDIPDRVAKLENRNSWYSGVIAAVSALFSSAMTILSLRK